MADRRSRLAADLGVGIVVQEHEQGELLEGVRGQRTLGSQQSGVARHFAATEKIDHRGSYAWIHAEAQHISREELTVVVLRQDELADLPRFAERPRRPSVNRQGTGLGVSHLENG